MCCCRISSPSRASTCIGNQENRVFRTFLLTILLQEMTDKVFRKCTSQLFLTSMMGRLSSSHTTYILLCPSSTTPSSLSSLIDDFMSPLVITSLCRWMVQIVIQSIVIVCLFLWSRCCYHVIVHFVCFTY